MKVRPTNEVSARLEHLQARFGYETLKDFHAALSEGGGQRFSYEAVRNYHHDRIPPLEYLVRVSDRWGVRLEWLAKGEGHVTKEEEETAQREAAALKTKAAAAETSPTYRAGLLMGAAFPSGSVPFVAHGALSELWFRVLEHCAHEAQTAEKWPYSLEIQDEASRRIVDAIRAPLLAVKATESLNEYNESQYALPIAQALLVVVGRPLSSAGLARLLMDAGEPSSIQERGTDAE